MSSMIKVPGTVLYSSLRVDEGDSEFKPYASYINSLIRESLVRDCTFGRSPTMDGVLYKRADGRIRVEYLDSPWGNDHYYVYQHGSCVYHCQDTPGRGTIQQHILGDWLSDLEGLAGSY